MLSVDEEAVKTSIADMENKGLLVKYTAIVNSEKADDALVEALIEVKVTPKKKEGFDGIAKQIASFPEVKSVYLMSGAFDLAIFVEGDAITDIAKFVAEKLSVIDGITSVQTHFILKRYKIEGHVTKQSDERQRQIIQA